MIAIIGAGISGLTLAYELQKQKKDFILIDTQDSRAGGYIQSIRDKEYLYELGPNSLLADEDLVAWLNELGLSDDLISANAVSQNRYIFKNKKYQKLPSSPSDLVFNNFFSLKTKLALFEETKNTTKTFEGETLSQFFERRFTKEIVEYALDPFVSGIYAGNPYELLVAKTFPLLVEYEKKYGSVIKGLRANGGGQRKKTISFKNGMGSLPLMLAAKVPIFYPQKGVEEITKQEKWHLKTANQTIQADKVVLSLPAYKIPELIEKSLPEFGKSLLKIDYSPMVVVHSLYYKKDVKSRLNGFGGLHPACEKLFTLGHIWSSSVFQDRCKPNEVLFTSFVGGSRGYEKTQLDDHQIMGRVHQEIKINYGIEPLPASQRIFRWQKAIPQYNAYILESHKQAENLEKENMFVCANWKDGVSLSDCIKKAKELAQKL